MRARPAVPLTIHGFFVALIILAIALSGCGGASADEPPDITEGRTECDECHMIIDDTRFAAAYRLPDGEEKTFDDIGDMLKHGRRNEELDDADIWVFDYESADAIEAPEAHYVVGGDIVTPMAFGVVAFADVVDAESYVAETGGELVDWDELQQMSADDELGSDGHTSGQGDHPDGDETDVTDHEPA